MGFSKTPWKFMGFFLMKIHGVLEPPAGQISGNWTPEIEETLIKPCENDDFCSKWEHDEY